MPAGSPRLAAPRAALEISRARLRRGLPGDRDHLVQELDSVRPGDIGLQPRSILIVPRLVADRPLARGRDWGRFAGSVTDSLKGALKRARRPWETHSADDCLLFDDELDAQTGVIAAWLAGSAQRHWWPAVTGALDPPAWWRSEILRDPFALVRIVARLAETRIAGSWIARLDSADVELGIRALAAAYGLQLSLPPREPVSIRTASMPSVAPLAAIAPEIDEPALAPRGRLLLAIALVAHRRPAFVSTSVAQRAFAALARADESAAAPYLPRPSAMPRQRDEDPSHAPERSPLRQSTHSPQRLPQPRSRPSPRATIGKSSKPPGRLEVVQSMPAPAPSVATSFGGILFLLNALIALHIFSDFTRPKQPTPALSPFALLAAIGSRWFGRRFRADPLYTLLLELAGEDRHSGASPPRWSIPRSWLAPWPGERSLWIDPSDRRTVLWHPAGFPVAELRRRDGRAIRQAVRSAGFRTTKTRVRLPRLPREPWARWVAGLSLYLLARLSRALGRRDALDIVCRQPAVIDVADDRLTARLALADHPLAVRMAGLDRDPGWIPAAGRIVEFAFE